eukprot:7905972-Pyramimonas_sp.AAC.1
MCIRDSNTPTPLDSAFGHGTDPATPLDSAFGHVTAPVTPLDSALGHSTDLTRLGIRSHPRPHSTRHVTTPTPLDSALDHVVDRLMCPGHPDESEVGGRPTSARQSPSFAPDEPRWGRTSSTDEPRWGKSHTPLPHSTRRSPVPLRDEWW